MELDEPEARNKTLALLQFSLGKMETSIPIFSMSELIDVPFPIEQLGCF